MKMSIIITLFLLLNFIFHASISSFFLCNMLSIKKQGRINSWWKITVFWCLTLLLSGALLLGISSLSFSRFVFISLTVIHLCLLLVITWFCFTEDLSSKAFVLFLAALADLLALFIFRPAFPLLFSGNSFPASGTIQSAIQIPFQNMTFLTLTILIIAFRKIILSRLHQKELVLYIVLPLYQLLLYGISLSTYQQPDESAFLAGSSILFLNTLVNFIVIFSINNLIEKRDIEEKLTALSSQRQTQLEYYQMAQKNVKHMRIMKENFSSHLLAIRSALENGSNTEQIPEMLNCSREDLNKNALPRYCQHQIINAILTVKKQFADENNIAMDIAVRMPESRHIAPVDLCSLFSNLLDNALEACQTVKSQQKYISIRANITGNFLIVKTENTYETPVINKHGIFQTHKEDADEHGYGLKLIERITDKYNGQLTIEHSDTIFTVTAALMIPD